MNINEKHICNSTDDCAESAAEKYIKKALALGADHAVFFRTDDIEFDPRTLLKCMFGCNDWGKGHTCPSRPGSLLPWEYEQYCAPKADQSCGRHHAAASIGILPDKNSINLKFSLYWYII